MRQSTVPIHLHLDNNLFDCRLTRLNALLVTGELQAMLQCKRQKVLLVHGQFLANVLDGYRWSIPEAAVSVRERRCHAKAPRNVRFTDDLQCIEPLSW